MFYYFRYSLNNLIEHKYITHFELFSAAVYMLCKEKVTNEDIDIAERMLTEFCDLFENYYGLSAITLNVHLLRHYGLIVRQSGPLWCHSLFGFESNMGVLAKFSSGGSNVLDQIGEKYIISKSIDANNENATNKTPKFFLCGKISSEKYGILNLF